MLRLQLLREKGFLLAKEVNYWACVNIVKFCRGELPNWGKASSNNYNGTTLIGLSNWGLLKNCLSISSGLFWIITVELGIMRKEKWKGHCNHNIINVAAQVIVGKLEIYDNGY